VQHPGTAPRNWVAVLNVKWAIEAERILADYLDKWSVS